MDEVTTAMTGELAEMLTTNSRPPVRFSHLKAMGRSPAHCRYAMQTDWEQTLSMRLGSATHSLLLGGPDVVTFPGKVRRGKEWDAFAEDHKADIIVTKAERAKAEAMAASVRGHEVANRVLFQPGTIFEETIYWEWMGRSRRSTPDARGHRYIVDLKTSRDCGPEKFRWEAIRMGYHAQLADYCKAVETVTGHAPRSAYIVAVESSAPFLTSVHELTPGALDIGGRLCRRWMESLLACEASGYWPGYSNAPIPFDVPDQELDLIFADDEEAS